MAKAVAAPHFLLDVLRKLLVVSGQDLADGVGTSSPLTDPLLAINIILQVEEIL